MPTGQASRASVLTSACLRASGASPRHSAIFCARSSKRTVRLISGVALDECRIRSVTGRAYHFEPLNAKKLERPSSFISYAHLESVGCEPVEETGQGFATFVPIAQSTERECPKLQVAGESPAGDTISRGCGSTAECRPCQGWRSTGAKPVRDAISSARSSRGIADPPGLNGPGSLGRASRLAPTIFKAPKAF